jgi:hypothetical protein
MRCPCSLYESLDHFTYQCPTIIEYRCRQMALIQNPPNPSLPAIQVIPPTLQIMFTLPPLNLRHFLPLHGSWIDGLRIYPQILPTLRSFPSGNLTPAHSSQHTVYEHLVYVKYAIAPYFLFPLYISTTCRQSHGDNHQCYFPGSPIFSHVPLRQIYPRGTNYTRFPMECASSQSAISLIGIL